MKIATFSIFGFLAGALFFGLAVYLNDLRAHIEFQNEEEEKSSPYYLLNHPNGWEPIHVSVYAVGVNQWALLLTDGFHTLAITSQTPNWDKSPDAVVHIANTLRDLDGNSYPVEKDSEEEKKLIKLLDSLRFAEHQEVFRDAVEEFIETLSDRSKFVFEFEELGIEPGDTDIPVYPPENSKNLLDD